MHTIQSIAKAERGTTTVTDLPANTLATELADYGVDCEIIDFLSILNMGDARFVERLNAIRLADQTLIIQGMQADLDAAKIARINIEYTLTNLGGRAVLAA